MALALPLPQRENVAHDVVARSCIPGPARCHLYSPERVRVALGYGQLNLFAGSYGTRAAQAFVPQYPKSVRTVYLGSPVPIDSGGPKDFARTEQDALDKSKVATW